MRRFVLVAALATLVAGGSAAALPPVEDLAERASDGYVVYSWTDHDFGHNHFHVTVSRYTTAPFQTGVALSGAAAVTVYLPGPYGVEVRRFGPGAEPFFEPPVVSGGELFFGLPPGFDRDAVVDLEIGVAAEPRAVARGFHNSVGVAASQVDAQDAIPEAERLD